MAITKKQELRALTEDERELVSLSGVRAARALTETELNRLLKRLRTRRDRARTVPTGSAARCAARRARAARRRRRPTRAPR